jgi:hypothetical protein
VIDLFACWARRLQICCSRARDNAASAILPEPELPSVPFVNREEEIVSAVGGVVDAEPAVS